MDITEKLLIEFVANAHRNQLRKYSNEPYYLHCIEVAKILEDSSISKSKEFQNIKFAAYMHDILEDTSTTEHDIRSFLKELLLDTKDINSIIKMIRGVTKISKREDGNREMRHKIDTKHLASQDFNTKTIKLADILSNTKDIAEKDVEFAKIYLKEKLNVLDSIKQSCPILWNLAYDRMSRTLKSIGE